MKKRIVCLVFALILALGACFVSCEEEETPAQFVPPPFDASAVVGTPAIAEGEKGYGVLDARGVYSVGVCGEIVVQEGKADIWFTSPAENTVWLKLRVLNKQTGEILGETGLIKPGEYVQSISFIKSPAKGSEISLRVMSYEPETYYSRGEVTLNTTAS